MLESDMKFLSSYLAVIKSFVIAMKLLEGEIDCHIGLVIPTIMSLQDKLQKNTDPIMNPLVKALKEELEARFKLV